MACLEFYAQIQIKIISYVYSINYIIIQRILAIAWQDLIGFNIHIRNITLYTKIIHWTSMKIYGNWT